MPVLISSVSQLEAKNVRLVLTDESGKTTWEVVEKNEAVKRAELQSMDLVLVHDSDGMPVVKICDYSKIEYDKQKSQKRSFQAKQKTIRIGIHTQEHDLARFAGHANEFIEEGHHVMVRMDVHGRDKSFKNIIEDQFKKFSAMVPKAKPGKIGGGPGTYTQTLS
jgi:translation initiation factor IF-3